MAAIKQLYRMCNISGRSLCFDPNSRFLPSLLVPKRGVASKLFVAGLSFFTTEQGLSDAFSEFGQVLEAKIIMDRASGRSKGFGFVTFASKDEAENAVSEMNGKVLHGRTIYVENSKPGRFLKDPAPIARGPPDTIRNS